MDFDIINIRFEYSDTIQYRMLNIQTQIQIDLKSSKRIQTRIRSENNRT
jgi:hypothetical protein